MNNFEIFTDFRISCNFLICSRKFDWTRDTRHSFPEFVAKSGQNFIKNSQKKLQTSMQKMEKIGNSFFIREKMLTIFGWNFEIWAVQKHVYLVDLVKSFPTNIFLQNLASIQPRTSPIKFAHLAEKSEKSSISNLSTKSGAASLPCSVSPATYAQVVTESVILSNHLLANFRGTGDSWECFGANIETRAAMFPVEIIS